MHVKTASTSQPDWEQLTDPSLALESETWQGFADAFASQIRFYFLSHGVKLQDAEDLTMDCLIKIPHLVASGKYQRGRGSFRGWVLTIAHHIMVDSIRKQKIVTISLEDERFVSPEDDNEHEAVTTCMIAAGPEEALMDSSDSVVAAVREAMAKLSPSDQEIIKLRFLEEPQAYHEIQADGNVSSGALRVRAVRAKQRLMGFLKEDPRIQAWLTAVR